MNRTTISANGKSVTIEQEDPIQIKLIKEVLAELEKPSASIPNGLVAPFVGPYVWPRQQWMPDWPIITCDTNCQPTGTTASFTLN